MRKELWLVVIMAIIIIILATISVWPKGQPGLADKNTPQDTGNHGITVSFPQAGGEVFSPLKIFGSVNGEGWVGFEGQVGTVRLLDESGKELALGILVAVSEWTELPTSFETTLDFNLEEDVFGTLIFKNENASGLPEKDKEFLMPVKIKSSKETSELEIFFNNSEKNEECGEVSSVKRTVPKTSSPARTALEQLFLGPTEEERSQGFYTNINNGVRILNLLIDSQGVAKADFSQELEVSGGSCKVSAIRAQITKTLEQFPSVKSVVISINGKTEEILQP